MKINLDSKSIAHVWASGSQEHGKCGNMSFQDGLFRSYGTGIARICKHKSKQYVLLNNRSFSVSTSKHQSLVRRAVSHMTQFNGDWGWLGTDMEIAPKEIVAHYRKEAEEKAKETSRYKQKMFQILEGAASRYERAAEAAEFFGLGSKKLKSETEKCRAAAFPYKEVYDKHIADSDSRSQARYNMRRERWKKFDEDTKAAQAKVLADFLEDHTASLPFSYHVPEEQLEAYKAQLEKRKAWEIEQKASDIEAWKRGEDVKSSLYDVPVMLRVEQVGDEQDSSAAEIVTSHGARIPYEDGKRCFRFYLKNREIGWQANGRQFEVGPYKLLSVSVDGIKAGCHVIHHDELMRLSAQEGWE